MPETKLTRDERARRIAEAFPEEAMPQRPAEPRRPFTPFEPKIELPVGSDFEDQVSRDRDDA